MTAGPVDATVGSGSTIVSEMGRSGQRHDRSRLRRSARSVLLGVALVGTALAWAGPAAAHGPAAEAAAALASSRVVVHPAAHDLLGQAEAAALVRQIGRDPVFVVVLPAGNPAERELAEIEMYVQDPGVYLVAAGDDLAGGVVGQGGLSDQSVARAAVDAQSRPGGVADDLRAAVHELLGQLEAAGRPVSEAADGLVPGSTRAGSESPSGSSATLVLGGGAAVVLVLAALVLVLRGSSRGVTGE